MLKGGITGMEGALGLAVGLGFGNTIGAAILGGLPEGEGFSTLVRCSSAPGREGVLSVGGTDRRGEDGVARAAVS